MSFSILRILCPLALAGIALHYMIYHLPQELEGKAQTYWRGGLQAVHIELEAPRHARRLVDATLTQQQEEEDDDADDCSCPCVLALEDEQEGWAMRSLDPDLILKLGGDPSLCMPKDQSVTLVAEGLGECDQSCVA